MSEHAFASFRSLPLVLVLALSCTARHVEAAEPRFLLSGFGTLGYAVLDDPDVEYRTGNATDGADERGSLEVDTRLGVQLDVEATERLSATLQVTAREGDDGDPEAGIEWAFLRWLASDAITLRVGRLALPVYALSDYRDVGYANTWLRPPEDVYYQVPLRNADGADLSTQLELGETLLNVQLYVGQTYGSRSLYGQFDLDARDAIGINAVVEHGPLRLRLGHVSARIGLDSEDMRQLRDAIAQAAPLVPALAGLEDEFSGRPKRTRFSAVGLSLDFERVFLDAEYTQRRIDSWSQDVDGWYLSVGARIGAFTPYAFVSASDGVEERRNGIDLPDLPPLAPLDAALDFLFSSNDQSTLGLGLRWDFASNLALKGQVEHVSGENGRISNSLARGNFGSDDGDGDVVLTSIALDFVF